MTQFKAGDKVVVTKSNLVFAAGETHVLKRFAFLPSGEKAWFMEDRPDMFYVSESGLRSQTLKETLKNGMRVKCRNGSMWTYIDGYFTQIGEYAPTLSYINPIENWADDLHNRKDCRDSVWDVMEISKSPDIVYYFNYAVDTPVIWKREEKSEAEKQLEEIQATIKSLTKQAIELAETIKQEKL